MSQGAHYTLSPADSAAAPPPQSLPAQEEFVSLLRHTLATLCAIFSTKSRPSLERMRGLRAIQEAYWIILS